jgi:UDP-2,3-diacylglucosamine hydrolase
MSPDTFELKAGALLVADAHYSSRRPQLLNFLKAVASGGIAATQLILMGDIFDLLFGGIPMTQERNREAVDTINAIAEKMEVLYLEGNHDFQLASVFPGIRVYPLAQQPVLCRYGVSKVLIAHGDWGSERGYRLYTSVIRSRAVLALLRCIDNLTGHSIIRWLDNYLEKKEDCSNFEGFEAYVGGRLSALDLEGIDYFFEGHHHQNRDFFVGSCRYVNLGAFACNQRYYEVQSINDQGPLKEAVFGKESR